MPKHKTYEPNSLLPPIGNRFRNYEIAPEVKKAVMNVRDAVMADYEALLDALRASHNGKLQVGHYDLAHSYAINAYAENLLFRQFDFTMQRIMDLQAQGKEPGGLMVLACKLSAAMKGPSYQRILFSTQIRREINERKKEPDVLPDVGKYLKEKAQRQEGTRLQSQEAKQSNEHQKEGPISRDITCTEYPPIGTSNKVEQAA